MNCLSRVMAALKSSSAQTSPQPTRRDASADLITRHGHRLAWRGSCYPRCWGALAGLLDAAGGAAPWATGSPPPGGVANSSLAAASVQEANRGLTPVDGWAPQRSRDPYLLVSKEPSVIVWLPPASIASTSRK
jgi:hypothetical protein